MADVTKNYADSTFVYVAYTAVSAAAVAAFAAYKATLPPTHVAHEFSNANKIDLYKSDAPAFITFLEAHQLTVV